MTNADKLNALFKELRRRDLVARQNFMCCGGCAAAAIGEDVRKRGKRGGVYYHRQDAERLRPSDRERCYGRRGAQSVFLGYGSADGDEGVAQAIGADIVAAAALVGLRTEWDGSAARRVEVLLPGGIDAPTLPSVATLRAEAQKADDAFGAALRREFGARAGDARYWHDGMYSFATRVLAGAKRAADERVRAAIEEGRA